MREASPLSDSPLYYFSLTKTIAPKIAASKRVAAISTGKIKPPLPRSLPAKAEVVGSSGGSVDTCHGVLSRVKATTPKKIIATIKAGIRNLLEGLPC